MLSLIVVVPTFTLLFLCLCQRPDETSRGEIRMLELNLALVKDRRTIINPCTGRL
jgi:hypothetical protein